MVISILSIGFGSARAQLLPDTTSNIPAPLLNEYATAVHDNWVWFGGGFKQAYWFLPNTVRRTTSGSSTFWAVSIQAVDSTGNWTSAREAIIADRQRRNQPTAGYETYLLTKSQWEVDCARQKLRCIRILEYNEDGAVINSGKTNSTFEEPVPDSNGENLLRVFCHPKLRRTFRELLEPK